MTPIGFSSTVYCPEQLNRTEKSNLNRMTTIQAVDCRGLQTSHLQHHHTQLGWADCHGANTLQNVYDTSGRLLRTADKSPSPPPYVAWLVELPRCQHTAERRREAGRNLNYVIGNKPPNKCLHFTSSRPEQGPTERRQTLKKGKSLPETSPFRSRIK